MKCHSLTEGKSLVGLFGLQRVSLLVEALGKIPTSVKVRIC